MFTSYSHFWAPSSLILSTSKEKKVYLRNKEPIEEISIQIIEEKISLKRCFEVSDIGSENEIFWNS